MTIRVQIMHEANPRSAYQSRKRGVALGLALEWRRVRWVWVPIPQSLDVVGYEGELLEVVGSAVYGH